MARIVSCSIVVFCRMLTLDLLDGDHRHVGLEYGAEEVTLRGHLLVGDDQVVLHVAQVRPQLLVGQARWTVPITGSSGGGAR